MQNPYAKYKEQSVMTMTQGDMINLLYEEIISRLNKAIICIGEKDIEGRNNHLKKARAIVTHLNATLDPKYDVAKGLSSLYEYFNHSIVQANINNDPAQIQEILPMVQELKDAFAQADKQVRMSQSGKSAQ